MKKQLFIPFFLVGLIGVLLAGCQGDEEWTAGQKEADAAGKISGLTGFKDVSTATAYPVWRGLDEISENVKEQAEAKANEPAPAAALRRELAGVKERIQNLTRGVVTPSATPTRTVALTDLVVDCAGDGTGASIATANGEIAYTETPGDETQPTGSSSTQSDVKNLVVDYTACVGVDRRGAPHTIWGTETINDSMLESRTWDHAAAIPTRASNVSYSGGKVGGYAFSQLGTNYKLGARTEIDLTYEMVEELDGATGEYLITSETITGTATLILNTIKCTAELTNPSHLDNPDYTCKEI